LFILFGIKNYHSSGRSLLLYIFIKRVIILTIINRGLSLLPTMYKKNLNISGY